MKRLLLSLAVSGVFAFSTVSAQTKSSGLHGQQLSFGVDAVAPLGNLSDSHKFGFGGSVQFQTPIVENLNFTASVGYLSFVGKYYNQPGYYPGTYNKVRENSLNAVPVKIGARYFITDKFYAGGEIGVAFLSSDGDSATAFAYSPNIGFQVPLANKKAIDLGVRFEGWSNNGSASFMGLRAAYNFGI